MESALQLRCRIFRDLPLQLLQSVAVVLQNRRTRNHYRIVQRVEQNRDVGRAQPRRGFLRPQPNRIPDIAGALLQREPSVLEQEEAQPAPWTEAGHGEWAYARPPTDALRNVSSLSRCGGEHVLVRQRMKSYYRRSSAPHANGARGRSASAAGLMTRRLDSDPHRAARCRHSQHSRSRLKIPNSLGGHRCPRTPAHLEMEAPWIFAPADALVSLEKK